MKILLIGDVMGKPGRHAVAALLPSLRRELELDFVIANGENAAAGRGLTPGTANDLFNAGVDLITSGNHIWDLREVYPLIESGKPVLRPINYPPGVAGRGHLTLNAVTVVSLQGRTFMLDIDCPFRAMDAALERITPGSIIVVDLHAEATSEKMALGHYLDGRVTALLGTHTHVPTADARILPKGTAYVSDVGMTGPKESVIGNDIDDVISRFLTALPTRMPVAENSPTLQLNSVLVEADPTNGKALSIQRIDREMDSNDR